MAEPHLTVRNHRLDKDVELFMSFGHLNELTKLLGGRPENLMVFDLDPSFVESVCAILVAKRDEAGKVTEIVPFDFSIEDGERIMDWVKEHLISFFGRRLQSTRSMVETNQSLLQALGSSPSGTPSEASKRL